MKVSIKKYGLVFMTLLISLSVAAQKEVRKNVRKGNKAYKEQKYSDAFKFYDNAVKQNPQDKEGNYNLGNTYYRQKEWDKSAQQYQQYLSSETEDPLKMSAAWHNIGNSLLQKKDLEKSMEAYKMALRLNPEDDETRYNLTVVQKMIQDQQDQQDQSGGGENQQQQQDQQQDQQQQNQNKDQQKKPEEQNQPEQMSRDNARQMLQAIEQDERETQDKVNRMKAEMQKEKAQNNKRNNKDW